MICLPCKKYFTSFLRQQFFDHLSVHTLKFAKPILKGLEKIKDCETDEKLPQHGSAAEHDFVSWTASVRVTCFWVRNFLSETNWGFGISISLVPFPILVSSPAALSTILWAGPFSSVIGYSCWMSVHQAHMKSGACSTKTRSQSCFYIKNFYIFVMSNNLFLQGSKYQYPLS